MLSIITGTNIDEYDGIRFPENGVHPNQFKNIAREILSKAMKTNEDICVITYSAMLIEFFEVLAKYIQTVSWIDINFIVDNKDGRKKYHIDDLTEMYDNLSKPYNDIEIIRLRTDYELEKMLSNEPCATAQDYKCRHCEDGCDVLLRKQGIIKTIDDENIERSSQILDDLL